MNSRSSARLGDAARGASSLARTARSLAFFVLAIGYLAVVMGVGQRLLLWPAVTLLPRRRSALMGRWIRLHARTVTEMGRVLAGMRLRVEGEIPPGPCLLVMNHQSIWDIPVLYRLSGDPYPLIPARDRYRWGIPGISPLARMARLPWVTQRRDRRRSDLSGIARAAEALGRGEVSIAIFPEGHRTRDGEIQPFKPRGLRTILDHARPRVVPVVIDGAWGARTFAEAARRMAGAEVRVRVLPPMEPPADPADDARFLDAVRARMAGALREMRGTA